MYTRRELGSTLGLPAAINHPEVVGIRVAPSVYTTIDEVDRFSEAIERVLREGIAT